MLSGLRNIVKKEVKELIRDPRILLGIILVPLLMFPLMGFMVRISQEATIESMKNISVAIINLDDGVFAQNLTYSLEAHPNLTVQRFNASSIKDVASTVQETNITAVIVIPETFSENLSNNATAGLEVYGVFRGGGIAEGGAFSAVNKLLQLFEQTLINQTLGKAGLNSTVVLNPVDISLNSIVKGEPVDVNPETLFTVAMSQFFGFPLAIMMLIILAMNLAATSVASEKEEKT
ncbi:MAG: ABC transporter permease, partial [Candidatus Bathyarchaeia archaeon]